MENNETRIIIVSIAQKPIGLIVDVTDAFDIPMDLIQKPELMGGLARENDVSYLLGIPRLNERRLILIGYKTPMLSIK